MRYRAIGLARRVVVELDHLHHWQQTSPLKALEMFESRVFLHSPCAPVVLRQRKRKESRQRLKSQTDGLVDCAYLISVLVRQGSADGLKVHLETPDAFGCSSFAAEFGCSSFFCDHLGYDDARGDAR